MGKLISLSVAALLTACGAAITANNAAESAPQTGAQRSARPAPQNAGDGWSGTYSGQFDGGRGTVEISSLGGSSYLVEVGTIGQGNGCSGGANGTGVARGNRMTMEMPNQYSPGICRITMDRNGATLSVREEDCLELHGAQCNFEGTVTRRGHAAAAPPPRTASAAAGSSWIVGAWVLGGTDNCGGDGFVVNADGTYADAVSSGRWSLAGNTLTTTMTTRLSGDDEIAVRPARVTRSQIVRHDPRTFSIRSPNGSVSHLVRCR